MRLRFAPKSMILDDFEALSDYASEFSRNFAWFCRFGRQQWLNEWR